MPRACSRFLDQLLLQWQEDRGISYRASSKLIRLAIVVLVVDRAAIAAHSHDVWEHGTRAVVLVRIEEEAQTLELVCMTKDVSRLGSLLGEPHCEAVAIQIALTADLKLELNLLA